MSPLLCGQQIRGVISCQEENLFLVCDIGMSEPKIIRDHLLVMTELSIRFE